MNTFIGIGRCVSDANTRTVSVGGVPTLVTDFTVAVNEGYGEHQNTVYVRCSVWRERGANLKPFLTKGRSVTIKGAISAQAWMPSKGELAGKPQAQLVMANPAIEFNTGNPTDDAATPFVPTEEE